MTNGAVLRKENDMDKRKNTSVTIRTVLLVLCLGAGGYEVSALTTASQIGTRLTFGINPGVFRAGQPASAELSVCSVSTSVLTLSSGNTFAFLVDSSVGTVGSFTTPISVSSATLLAADFTVSFGTSHSQVIFRYQLTCIGGFAPVYIAEKVANNRFRIAGGAPGMEVSWQVTGIRRDAWADAHRIPVEENKPEMERGSYLHPELFGQPEEKGVE
jgi:hypothetical protein